MHVARGQRHLCCAKGGRGRCKKGQCLPERDDAMSLRTQLRGPHIQGIERRQLDVQHARRQAHREKISFGMTIEAPALRGPAAAFSDRRFYMGLALAAAAIVYVGFSPSYFHRTQFQSTPLPTYLHVHGFLFTMWIALFIVQTTLVAARRTNVHRRLGWVTAGLAVAMVVAGTTAGILSMRIQVEAGNVDQALAFLTTPLFSMVMFAGLVAAAIARRRDPQTHKRLMVLATISILDAAVARLPFAFLRSSTWIYLPVTDVFLAAAILYDVVQRRSVHPAYIWGGLLLVIEQALRIPVGETEAWKGFARLIIGG
jgi:hypothetical protein